MGLDNCNSFELTRFGRIAIMIRRNIYGMIALLAVFINSSCASLQPETLIPSDLASATPTPFQPSEADIPFVHPLDAQPITTFTPYPTKYVIQNNLPSPQIIVNLDTLQSSATNPLTGLQPEDLTRLERRPIAVKVANFPRYIRPQSGLTHADVIFEYYIEDFLTRFIAVYYGEDSTAIGPVRSGRYFDAHITHMYHSFLAFKFADPREYSFFQKSDFADFLLVPPGYGTCPPYFVGKNARDYYNNVFFDSTRMAECTLVKGWDNSRQMIRNGFFNEESAPASLSARRVFINYSADSYNYWEYDPATRKYLRYQELTDIRDSKQPSYEPLIDKENQIQVNTENLVVLYVPHIYANENEAEDEVYHINLLSTGKAYIFRDGFAYDAQWNRIAEDQPLLLTDMAGTPIFLRPGRTFFQVIGRDSTAAQDGMDIFFNFNTP